MHSFASRVMLFAVLVPLACGSRTALLGRASDSVDLEDGGDEVGADAGDARCGAFRARVFLTSSMYTGDLGGVSGADAKCTALAQKLALGGAWRAWLSDPTTRAGDHIYPAPRGYALLDGTVIAASHDALLSGSLAHAIDRTERNASITDGNTEVWTGTAFGGDPRTPAYCEDGSGRAWSSRDRAAPFAYVGHSNATDSTWSNVYLQFCDRTNVRLYCFESCD